jgi:ABC-2 type transport system permease protein
MHLLALTLKDIRLLLRDRAGLFFALGFPLVYAVMFGLIFGSRGGGEQGPELTVVVVDDDRTDESRQFVETLVSAGELVVEPVETVEEAMRLVRTGQRVAYVRLTEGFGDAAPRPACCTASWPSTPTGASRTSSPMGPRCSSRPSRPGSR